MAAPQQGGTTTNASSFSLNEDIKLPMGGRYQPTSSVGVFGGPQQGGMFNMGNTSANSFTKSRNEFEDVYAAAPMANTAMGGQPNGYARQATPNPNAQGFDSFRSNAGLPPPMPEMDRMAGSLRSDYNDRGLGRQPTVSQPMAQGGYNVNTASAQGLQQAQQGAAAGMGYRPMAITAPSQGGLQQYTNPYESQVVQQSLADLERSRLMAQNVGGAQASAANAFGGDRQGIAEAETNRAFADQAARTASGLRQTGYQNAQSMARQASIANQNAGLAGSQQRLNASNQLGSLSNLGFGMGQTIQNRMDQQGAMQQALQQQLINAGKQQYAGYTGAPAQSLQYLLQAVGGAPTPQNTTQGYSPGLFDYLTLAGTTYAGIN